VPARINKDNRIIPCIGISVKGLGVGRVLDDGVGGDESSTGMVVVSGVVKVKTCGIIQPLTGKFMRKSNRTLI